MVINFYPEIQTELFIPFLNNVVIGNSFDFWQSWISSQGRTDAFPYGFGMVIPLAVPIYIVKNFLGSTALIIHLTVGFTLLLLDALVLTILIKVSKNIRTACLYAFSPLALYISYYHGQLDIVPSSLFLFTLISLKFRKMFLSGILLGFAISAKLSFLLIVPFFMIFYLNNIKYRNSLNKLFFSSILTFSALQMPLFFSYGYRIMVLETPEINRIFYYTINLASTSTILIFPTVYVGLLLWLWRAGRTTFDVLITFFTASLIAIAIFAPGAIGWLFWSIPLLAFIALRENLSFMITVFTFHLLAIVTYADQQKGAVPSIWEIDFISVLDHKGNLLQALFETAFFCIGIVLLMSLLRTAVSSGDIYSLNSKPISLAIAGDSGVGKDLLANNLKYVFGSQATAIIHGDNYHKYERNSQKWKTYTHLNPEANDLKLLVSDVRKILYREPVLRRTYDHEIGRFKNPVELAPADFVILNGLHSLSLGNTQELIDLNVFLSMSEDLRIKLKSERDLVYRKQSKENIAQQILERSIDTNRYINSQINLADVVFNLREINPEGERMRELELKVETNGLNFLQDLVNLLRIHTTCNLDFQMPTSHNHKLVIKNVEIEIELLDKIIDILIPGKDQLFLSNYKLKSGIQGLMVLICILGIVEKRIGTKEITYE